MLLLAAANRFHLGPRLEVMVREGNYDRSVALMRNSILTEFVVAIIILGAVAWLGMLAPSQSARGQPKLMREIFTFISAS
jgi:putative copper resistance protein D